MNRQVGLKPKVTELASILSWYFVLILLVLYEWVNEFMIEGMMF